METIMVIPPQGKRKHKIVFEAVFQETDVEVEEVIANTLGKMGLFE